MQKLQEKQPPASGGLDDLPDINPDSALSVTEIEVRQAVLSFPAGSSCGPDGMRPQHLKDMMLCRESGTDFLAALTGSANVVLAGLWWPCQQYPQSAEKEFNNKLIINSALIIMASFCFSDEDPGL